MTGSALDRGPWGQAWLDAIDRRGRLDPGPATEGRAVHPVAIEAGSARASVDGRRAEAHRVGLDVRTLAEGEWQTVFGVIAGRARHTAALIDGELDAALIDDLSEAGVDLFPTVDEIDPWCSCPDRVEACTAADAVVDLVADTLDDDPLALLRLRGRSRPQALAAVRRIRVASTRLEGGEPADAEAAEWLRRPADEGVSAAASWARARRASPAPPPPPPRPAHPAALPVDPPADADFSATGLRSLATDAATRAWEALADGTSLGLAAGFDDDVVRRSVTARRLDDFAEVAQRLGASAGSLSRRAAAWELGGRDGLAMLDEPTWPVDPLLMSAARLDVEKAIRGHRRGEIDGNRLTFGDIQLRLSRTGAWWSFERLDEVWQPLGGPARAADELIGPRSITRR